MLNLGNISQRNFSGLSGEVFTIEDNRKNAKKPLTELAWFKKNYDVIIANPDALKQANENFIERVPVDEIHVNRELFQNRKKAYSSDSTNRIIEAVENGTFNIKVFDPVLLWRSDEDGLLYVLSGHSRTEAFRQLAKTNPNFSTIPAKILDVSKETAIEIALNSNTLSTRESDSERAYYYHYLMNNMGKDKKEVKEKCYSQEGANASRIWKMSFLNPNGKAIDSLDSLESGDQQSRAKMQAIVAWLGAARLRRPVLTNEHENELYVWLVLQGGYGEKPGQVINEIDFIKKVDYLINRQGAFFEVDKPLNIRNIQQKSSFMSEYETKIREIEKELNKALAIQEKKGRDLEKLIENGEIKAADKNRLLEPFLNDVSFFQRQLLKAKLQYGNVVAAERNQTALFGVKSNRNIIIEFNILYGVEIYFEDNKEKDSLRKYIKILWQNWDSYFYKKLKFNKIESNFSDLYRINYSDFMNLIQSLKKTNSLNGMYFGGLGKPYIKLEFEDNDELQDFVKLRTNGKRTYSDLNKKAGEVISTMKNTLSAPEILMQNKALDFNGFSPTYRILNDYSHLIAVNNGKTKDYGAHGNKTLVKTLELIKEIIYQNNKQVAPLAAHLKGNSLIQTAFNIWHWMVTNIKYAYDKEGFEELRTPARIWADRFTGVDCDDFSIMGACLLVSNGYTPELVLAEFKDKGEFSHIYISINKIVIDGVMKKFNKHPDHITTLGMVELGSLKIHVLSGLSGLDGLGNAPQSNFEAVLPAIAGIRNGRVIWKNPGSMARGYKHFAGLEAIDDMTFNGLGADSEEIRDTARAMLHADFLEGLEADGLGDLGAGILKKAISKMKAAVKTVATKVAKAAKKVGEAAVKVAKKVVQIGLKVGLLPARMAFIGLLKLNFAKISSRLYYAYKTEAEIRALGINVDQWNKTVAAKNKLESLFVKAGGQASELRKGIENGRGAKKAKAALKGLGEPVEAGMLTAASAFIKKALDWVKKSGIDFKKMFNGAKVAIDEIKNIATDETLEEKAIYTAPDVEVVDDPTITTPTPIPNILPPNNGTPPKPTVSVSSSATPYILGAVGLVAAYFILK